MKKITAFMLACVFIFLATACTQLTEDEKRILEEYRKGSTISASITPIHQSETTTATIASTETNAKTTTSATVKKPSNLKATTTTAKTTPAPNTTEQSVSITTETNYGPYDITIPMNKSFETFFGTVRIPEILIETDDNYFMVKIFVDTIKGIKIQSVLRPNNESKRNVTVTCYNKYGNKFYVGGYVVGSGTAIFDKEDYYNDGEKPQIIGYKNAEITTSFRKFKDISELSHLTLAFEYNKQTATIELDLPV